MAKKGLMTDEERKTLCLFDDILFRIASGDNKLCEELIEAVIGKKVSVIEATPQYEIKGFGRGVRLDVKCRLEDGSLCNVEVQKKDIYDDIKRTRYNASSLLLNETPAGADYKDIPDVYVIYIAEYDVLHNGQVCTEVCRCQKLNGEYIPVNDGEKIYFANAAAEDDGTLCYRYLKLMKQEGKLEDKEFPKTCERVNYYKFSEEGGKFMKEDISKRIYDEGFEEGIEEGIDLLKKTVRMLKDGRTDAEILAAGIKEPVLNEAKALFSL